MCARQQDQAADSEMEPSQVKQALFEFELVYNCVDLAYV